MRDRTVSELAVVLKTGIAARMEAALEDEDFDDLRDCISLMVEVGEAIASKVKIDPTKIRPLTDDEMLSCLKRADGDIVAAARLADMTYSAFYMRLRNMRATQADGQD